MSSRPKRKFDIDPNASDPDDYDYDASERAPPQRRRNRGTGTPGAKKKSTTRQRRAYGGSDVDNDDEIVSDDSFTDRSESEEPEINPATGRSVRRATKKQIKYEESEEDEIEDTPSEGDDDKPPSTRRRAKPSIEEVAKPSLIVRLKMPDRAPGRNLRTRTSSKSIARGKTPEVAGTRRSSRLSHDVETPIVALSDSGRHVNVVREGTRSPEPVAPRATRGGKGPRVQYPSAIMEASQEASMVRDDDDEEDFPGPLDELLGEPRTEVEASKESSPVQEAQSKPDDDDEGMEGVIQESQHEGAAEESEEEEGPIIRGGRSMRVSVCIRVLMISTNMISQPVLDQLNARGESTKAVTLSLPLKKAKERKTCLTRTMPRARHHHRTAHLARGGDLHVFVVAGHDSHNAVDVTHRLTNTL
jgi:hypothetical protein